MLQNEAECQPEEWEVHSESHRSYWKFLRWGKVGGKTRIEFSRRPSRLLGDR